MNRIGLINYEGDCLYAIRNAENQSGLPIVVYDQHDCICKIYKTKDEFLKWVDGRSTLIDSDSKVWKFTEAHHDARPTLCKIFEFINPRYDDKSNN